MRKILSLIKLWLKEFGETLVSFLRVILFASASTARKVTKIRERSQLGEHKCVILGNGPSLKEAIINMELDEGDYFAVNLFVLSEDFWTLKPIAYFLVDPYIFYSMEERAISQRKVLVDAFLKVDWSMMLIVPQMLKMELISEILNNKNINVIKVNSNDFIGYKPICHWFYRYNLAMVPCQTVLNAALMFALNLGYKEISLYGADHTWTKDLIVNDDNEVCYGDRHVYKTNVEYSKLSYNMGTILDNFSKMFKSHYLIREYADYMGVKIINKTIGSFVDAYERK